MSPFDIARIARWNGRFSTALRHAERVETVATLGEVATDSALLVKRCHDNVSNAQGFFEWLTGPDDDEDEGSQEDG